MADRQVVIQIQYDLPDQREVLDKLTKTTKEINNLRESNKKLRKQIKDDGDANGELTRQLASQEAQVKDLSKEKRIYQNQLNATNNSAGAYRARLAELNRQMEQVDQSTEEGRAELARLKTEYDAIRHQVNAYDEAQGRHQHNVGNYQSALEGVRGSVLAIGAAIGAGIAAFNRLSSAMSESIAAFQQQEQAEAQLAFVAGDATDELLAQASALQGLTTFGDEATIASQQLLLSFGSTAEQVKELTPLIQDYAAAKRDDLGSVTNQLNNVLNGESTTLRGLKLDLTETSTQTERYAAVKEALNKFSGQAQALAQTESGRLEQLNMRYGDLQEELGERLLPIQLKMTEAKVRFLETLLKVADGSTALGKGFRILAGAAAAYVGALVALTAAKLRATIQQIALNLAVLANPYVAAAAAVGAIVAALVVFGEKLRAVVRLNDLFNIALEFGQRKVAGFVDGVKGGIDILARFADTLGIGGDLLGKVSARLDGASNSLKANAEASSQARAEDKAAAQAKREALEATIAYAEGLESLNKVSQSRIRASRDKTFATREEAKAEAELLLRQYQRIEAELALAEAELARVKATAGFNMETFAAAELQQQVNKLRLTLSATEDAVRAVREWEPASDAAVGGIEATTDALDDLESQIDDLQPKIDALDFSELEAELNGEVDLTPKLVDFDPSGISEELEELSETFTEDVDPAYQAYLDAQQKAIERAEQLEQRTEAAGRALSFFGQSNEQILGGLMALGEEATKADKAFASLAAGYNIANQALDQRFENQRANIEEATRAEIEGIEASTMSEEQKRIRIERAEQKKAQELDKLDLKQRRVQKSRDVIQSIINTALAITKVLANPFLVAFAAATGAAQTALIASQQFAEGGIAEGPSHAQGGIPFTVAGVGGYEMEGGEAIINRKSTAAFAPILSAINSYNGYGKRFQMGGLVGSPDTAFLQPGGGIEGTVRRMADSMQRLKVVNVLTEQNSAQNLLQNSLNEGSF